MEYQHIYVISKFSPIFLKGFKEFFHDMYIHTSSIFPQSFQGAFWLITRPQEDQINYKTTRRTNWSRESVTKKNRISDQFIN